MVESSPQRRGETSGVRHELPILFAVLGTAVVFGAIVSFLPGLGRTAPEEVEGSRQYLNAQRAEKEDDAKAIDLYAAIKPESGEWYPRAQARIARLQAEIAARPPKPSPTEQKDYDELVEFWRRNAGDYDELIRKGETFVLAHPRGELRPEVEARIAQARQSRAAKRVREAEEVEAAVASAVERRDFGGAILAIEKASGRLRTELDAWTRLAAKRDDVVEKARRFYQSQLTEANRLVQEGRKDDARRLWYSTLRSLGDGRVKELADLHRAAAMRSEEIRP